MAIAFKEAWFNSTPADGCVVSIAPDAGDFLIGYAITDANDTPLTPSGWTADADLTSTYDNADLATFHKVATGGESSVTFDFDSGNACIAGVVSYSGVDTTTPLDVAVATFSSSVGATFADVSITPVTNGAMLVHVRVVDDGNGDATFTFSTQSGSTGAWSVRNDQNSGFYNVAVGDALQSTAGAVTARCVTNQTGGRLAVLYALRPAAGGGGTQISVSDSGAGADALAIAVGLAVADAGSGVDQGPAPAVALALADAGAGADALTIGLLVSIVDAGSGVDAIANAVLAALTEAAAGSDAIAGISVSASVGDIGSGADSLTLSISLALADAGAGSDAISVLQTFLVNVADAGSGADAIGVAVSVPVADTGSGTDQLTLAALLAIAEAAGGVDVVVRFDAAVRIATISFTLAKRAIAFALATRAIAFSLTARSVSFALN